MNNGCMTCLFMCLCTYLGSSDAKAIPITIEPYAKRKEEKRVKSENGKSSNYITYMFIII